MVSFSFTMLRTVAYFQLFCFILIICLSVVVIISMIYISGVEEFILKMLISNYFFHYWIVVIGIYTGKSIFKFHIAILNRYDYLQINRSKLIILTTILVASEGIVAITVYLLYILDLKSIPSTITIDYFNYFTIGFIFFQLIFMIIPSFLIPFFIWLFTSYYPILLYFPYIEHELQQNNNNQIIEMTIKLHEQEPGKEEECSICKHTFEQGNQTSILSCQHLFHETCIKRWLIESKRKDCPLCRKIVVIDL